MTNIKEIQKQIRAWKKLKKNTKKNTLQRRNYNRKIRALKQQLEAGIEITDKKKELIKEIKILTPDYILKLNINYFKFTEEQLEKHIILIKEKRNNTTSQLSENTCYNPAWYLNKKDCKKCQFYSDCRCNKKEERNK